MSVDWLLYRQNPLRFNYDSCVDNFSCETNGMGLLKKHLKARMTVYFLLVSIPVVVLLAGTSFFLAVETLKEMAVARFDVIADHKEREINRFMADQIEIVQGIAALDAYASKRQGSNISPV
ncbi:MAG: hypothetical protein V7731_21940 [Amphritea sp.]